MKNLIPKLIIVTICVLLCTLNSTPTQSQSSDLKKEYTIHIYTGDARFKGYHEKKISETVKSYVIQQLHQIPNRDIRVMEGTSSTDPFSLVILSYESEDATIVNMLPIFIFKEVLKEIKIPIASWVIGGAKRNIQI